jgi:hypothetical protein
MGFHVLVSEGRDLCSDKGWTLQVLVINILDQYSKMPPFDHGILFTMWLDDS